MQIEVWTLGKDNYPYIEEGVQNYISKLKSWVPLKYVVIPTAKKNQQSNKTFIKQAEEELIIKKLNKNQYLILLDENGLKLDSPTVSKKIEQCMNQSVKTLVFLIGGAYGVSDNIKSLAQQVWSLSPLVFPHQLVRLILAEQIYRAYSILNNTPYHHE